MWEADEPIVEIATDKVDSEVPAPEDGTLVEWCVAEGDVVQVGVVIARYNVGGEAADAAPAPAAAAAPSAAAASVPAAEPAPAPEVVAAAMAPLDRCTFSKRTFRPFLFTSGEQHCPKGRHRHGRTRTSARHWVRRAASPRRTSWATSPSEDKLRPQQPPFQRHSAPVAPAPCQGSGHLPRRPRPRSAWMAPTTSWKWTECAR